MLPRKLKIGNRLRIAHVFKKGRRISSSFFQWRYLPNREKHHRFSIVMASKFSKTAVERNQCRRRVYEAIRKNLPPPKKTCYDVVCLPRPAVKDAAFPAIEKAILDFSLFLR